MSKNDETPTVSGMSPATARAIRTFPTAQHLQPARQEPPQHNIQLLPPDALQSQSVTLVYPGCQTRASLHIPANGRVRFTAENESHTLCFAGNEQLQLRAGDEYVRRFSEPVELEYFCVHEHHDHSTGDNEDAGSQSDSGDDGQNRDDCNDSSNPKSGSSSPADQSPSQDTAGLYTNYCESYNPALWSLIQRGSTVDSSKGRMAYQNFECTWAALTFPDADNVELSFLSALGQRINAPDQLTRDSSDTQIDKALRVLKTLTTALCLCLTVPITVPKNISRGLSSIVTGLAETRFRLHIQIVQKNLHISCDLIQPTKADKIERQSTQAERTNIGFEFSAHTPDGSGPTPLTASTSSTAQYSGSLTAEFTDWMDMEDSMRNLTITVGSPLPPSALNDIRKQLSLAQERHWMALRGDTLVALDDVQAAETVGIASHEDSKPFNIDTGLSPAAKASSRPVAMSSTPAFSRSPMHAFRPQAMGAPLAMGAHRPQHYRPAVLSFKTKDQELAASTAVPSTLVFASTKAGKRYPEHMMRALQTLVELFNEASDMTLSELAPRALSRIVETTVKFAASRFRIQVGSLQGAYVARTSSGPIACIPATHSDGSATTLCAMQQIGSNETLLFFLVNALM